MHILGKSFAGLFLLLGLCSSGWAQVIHWELDAYMEASAVNKETRTFSGGFDFNTVTEEIFNVTVMSTGAPGCRFCFDYSGATASVLRGYDPAFPDVEDSVIGVKLQKRVDFEPPVYQIDRLSISNFNPFLPGTNDHLNLHESYYLFIDEPLDPDIFSEDDCYGCATMVGTLVPVPEPETYAMLLAGLGLLGFSSRNSRRKAFLPRGGHHAHSR